MRHSGRTIHFLVELIDRSANRGLVSAESVSLARTSVCTVSGATSRRAFRRERAKAHLGSASAPLFLA